MKTRSSTITIALCVLAFAACKKDNKDKADTATPAKPTAAAPTTPTPAPAPSPAPTPPPAPAALPAPDFTTTASDLYAEFRPKIEAGKADGVRAKYTGKIVRISGEITDNSDMIGTWELALKANAETGHAFLHPSAAGAAALKALKVGAQATFQCVSAGWEIGPQLNDCVVVP